MTETRPDQFAAFRHSSYARYFTARFFSSTAVQILATAVGWQIYDETGSAFLLGMIGLVQFLPAILLVIPAGLASDRIGRRFIMGSTIWLEMLCATIILALALSRNFDPVLVLTVLTVFGIGRAFYTPAASSLAVNLVPREDFPNAVGWNTASWQLAHIAGPAAGGLIYGISAGAAYGTSVTLLLMAGLLIFSIPKPPQRIESEPTSLSVLLGGFRYIWKEKVVLGAISLDLFAVFLGGAVALMPIYARDILELGPEGLHVLLVCPGPILRDEATARYAAQAMGLPAEARLPGGGANLKGIDPQWLAERILTACERRQTELVAPWKVRVLAALSQLSPRLGDWLLVRSTSKTDE